MTKIAFSLALLISFCMPDAVLQARVRKHRRDGSYVATAYCTRGTTASGDQTRQRIVAADPRVLPLDSKIRIVNAGRYSGEYTVADTGRKIRGRKIDIFIPNVRAAKRFGKRPVQVKVIKLADPAPVT